MTSEIDSLPPSPPDRTGWPWSGAEEGALQRALSSGYEREWPRITIVTPSYNQAAYLEETLRSVLLQRYPNLEYIVIDGASTDGSRDIIQKYSASVRSWLSEPDRGQSHAINKGFARSTGEIMGWLNSDDTLAPGTLWRVAEQLGNVEGPAWIIGATEIVDAAGNQIRRRGPGKPTRERMLRWGDNWFPQQSTFWNRSLWELAGPVREDLHYSMDLALWLEMIRYADPILIEDKLSSYRFHDQAKCKSESGRGRPGLEKSRLYVGLLLRSVPEARKGFGRGGAVGLARELSFATKLISNLAGRKRDLLRLIRS